MRSAAHTTGAGLQWAWRAPRVPLVLQTEAAECGLACLAMVAGAHGLDTDLPALRQRLRPSMKGMSAADLADMGATLGLAPRAVRAEPEQLEQLALPCVLHWDLNHFVVLVALRRGVATLHDPAQGLRRLRLAELSPHFTGVVLEFRPTAAFQPRQERQPLRLRQLTGRITGLKRALAQLLLLALALELFVMLSPFFLQWVVDNVLVTGERELLVTLGLGFAGLVLVQAATAAARSWAVLYLSSTLKLQWQGHVFAHLLRLPLGWFERRHTGDVWSRFGAVQAIQERLTTHFVEAVIDGLMVLLTLALMLAYSPLLAAVTLGTVAAYALLRLLLWRPMREAGQEALVREARQASHFLESLRGVGAIKRLGAEAQRQSAFMNRVVDSMNASLGLRRLELVAAVGHRLLFGLERVVVVWLGALAVLDLRLSTGMLFAFLAYRELFAMRTSALVDRAGEWALLRLQAERLADIVLTPPEDDGDRPPRPPPAESTPQPAGLTLQDLHFRYADREPDVLQGFSLVVAPGESVAIAGPSGCGKSTLLKLLLGVHAPDRGSICLDGQPLAQLGPQAWRQQVGAVLQDEPLFAGSVADNIHFFAAEVDVPWMEACARLAAVHDELCALPMGYATLVGDMGTVLSGGQKQRILLARALYRRPRILLLDEATSALDVDRERQVNQAVAGLKLTRIIVAHRPETLASADRVVEMADGRVLRDSGARARPSDADPA